MNESCGADQESETTSDRPLFIDAFSGCGGLSLGLLRAGWRGLFAIEKDAFAFETFRSNLLEGRFKSQFDWPQWLPQSPTCVTSLIGERRNSLMALRGKVALLAGGPPCQGFSSAGRRDPSDPRNSLMKAYLELVQLAEPAIVLLENVRGITVDFNQTGNTDELVNYADFLRRELGETYQVYWTIVNASDYGVPQARTRFILVAFHRGLQVNLKTMDGRIDEARRRFLRKHRLLTPISTLSALSDLELQRNGSIPSPDTPGFNAINYHSPRTNYQRLMRDGYSGVPSDTRLARHNPHIAQRFREIIAKCNSSGRLNTSLSREMREEYSLKKQALRVLDPQRPAPTITSMPDDLLHYSEPRTLTVRENARLQGFPDWFAFRGKYTTGGHRRRLEVPRFTQVANAVPPFLAEVLGTVLLDVWQHHLGATSEPADPHETSIQLNVYEHCNTGEILPMFN
ncbi:MAG: DNA cytosine methyltransferase [Mesorhizobium sp.]|uniref:DNA cytosine methyltransferase n=1 Tax=Mesorhizobium sp. TaxID=1871066 RepID=UPI001220FD79|nr:DNA cytosine methyltransferase [Mesorhizobium sp.]TIR14709.1 MAG: DNA cytosine methyltransferase [Mesorhizobium sp.]